MVKNGLELGKRVEILSKKYRTLNDLLLNPKEVLGTCKFIKNEGAQFVNINLETGEGDYDGVEVLVYSEGQEDVIFLKVTEQSEEEINALNLLILILCLLHIMVCVRLIVIRLNLTSTVSFL